MLRGDVAFELLTRLLAGEVDFAALARPPFTAALRFIGSLYAQRLIEDEFGDAVVHWPRVWAARTLAYLVGTMTRRPGFRRRFRTVTGGGYG